MKLLFIINPKSGGESNDEILSRIKGIASSENVKTEFLYTTGNEDEQAIKKSLQRFQPDRVIAGGGDGTIQMVVKNLMGTPFPLAILPIGSANGLATSLDIPLKAPESVDYLFGPLQTVPLDLLLINDTHICVHLADIGINARIVKEYAEEDGHGMMGYAKHLITAIKETPLMHYTITTENQTFQKEGYMLTFANTNRYGTGIHITEGSAHDGVFEIRNIPKVALDDAIKASLTRFNIFIDDNMSSEVISCKQAEIIIDQKVELQIDGEYMGPTDFVKIKILPGAVSILIP